MISFYSFSGIVTGISNFASQSSENAGCNKFMSVIDRSGNIVNFVVSPDTYFADQKVISVGDIVTGYYDGNAPAILIYPPQYPALIVVKYDPNQNVKVDYFNSQLISSDGQLKLNIAPNTQIMLKNGQPFTGNPANRNLIVFYGPSTRSIPAQTTPDKIIVWC
jgi:hypothetical protein